MKFIILFFYIPLVYSELHTFITTYTGIHEQTTTGIPEFSAVTTLDDQQIDYYDSNTTEMIPKQDWIRNYTSTELWKEDIEIRKYVQQMYRNIIPVLMQRFNQTHGVHTYQRMYGCEWDDETEDSHGFDQYAYDGEDFISLDLKENRYIASVQQALLTAMKWNNDRTRLTIQKQYFQYDCVYWLKKFLNFSKDTFKKAVPEVSLLQKEDSDYHTCHVTGFLFRNTSILWRKNGEALSDSSNLTSGDTLPNEDGTFQRRLTLYVLPGERREDEYSCVVEHKSLTETIQKNRTVNKSKRNSKKPESASDTSYIIYLVPIIIILVTGLLIGLYVRWKHRMKLKAYSKKTFTYFKSKPSQEPAPSQDSQESLLSTPSNECPSPPVDTDSLVSGSSLFPHSDAENLFPELPLHSSSLVDRSSQLHPTTTESFYTVQETSKDL
ncbi:hypothetical protein R3I93_016804 [Phoxinus phoxinus]|uniref:Ig-like domain-containing protein n=1 Tax=Phoxinus phoxinus TaxID=58324 RepID=A0AAN9CH01_9TELE